MCFFIIYKRLNEDFTPIYKSEIQKSESSGLFFWRQVQVGSTDLCRDEDENEIKIDFYCPIKDGNHKHLAKCLMTLAQLKSGQLIRPMIMDGGSGQLTLEGFRVEAKYSFLQYVAGGCNIDLSIAVDFTGSNGHPSRPGSLHYFDPESNQYIQAIRSVGEILQHYDSDKQINVYGYGGLV